MLATACGSLQPYAAIVNGVRIPQHDIDNELKAIRANGRYLDAIDPTRKQILRRLFKIACHSGYVPGVDRKRSPSSNWIHSAMSGEVLV